MDYYRPKSIEEALGLLERGLPLAGGTGLTPRRRHLEAVVDLRDLGLEGIRVEGDQVIIGATTPLQALVDSSLLPSLRETVRREAGWNLRNMATLGGTLMAGDGRSPTLTALLALEAVVLAEPGGQEIPLVDLLGRRGKLEGPFLITSVRFEEPKNFAYEQVARSPADRPLVCAAAAAWKNVARIGLALGGWGSSPLRLEELEVHLVEGGDLAQVREYAAEVCAEAGDAFAGAEYRAHAAGVLLGRVVGEVSD